MRRIYLSALTVAALGLSYRSASAQPWGYQQYNVNCSSIDYRPNYCPVNGYISSAYLSYQMSNNRGPCILGQTWGYDSRAIWVNSGCRGIFTVTVSNGYGPGPGYPGRPYPGRPGPGRPGPGYPGRPGPGYPGHPGHGPGRPGHPGHRPLMEAPDQSEESATPDSQNESTPDSGDRTPTPDAT